MPSSQKSLKNRKEETYQASDERFHYATEAIYYNHIDNCISRGRLLGAYVFMHVHNVLKYEMISAKNKTKSRGDSFSRIDEL